MKPTSILVLCGWLLGQATNADAATAEARSVALQRTVLQIAARWVGQWFDKEWDEAKGIFKFRHGPYSDAFEHHYVAAVLINTPESKFYRHEALTRRVVSDLVFHSKVFIEQCGDKGLRGYWTLNSASDKGVPVGSGSWQARSYLRACWLLDKHMTDEQQRLWREGAKWLMAALTVDWKETFGPWWSSNKVADHIAAVAQWLLISRDPEAKAFLDRQFEWFWRAFPEEGCADKYHNYFAKTMYRLAPIVLVPEAQRYHEEFFQRMKLWRSFITPHGLYDQAGHPEPNGDEVWFTKLGCVLSCLLLACPRDPELAVVARHLVEQRLADHSSESFWRGKFNHYFDGHWGSLGLIIETAPVWQKVMARPDLPDFDQLRFFDYWRGLGRVAVKTERYQASCYLGWAWTWDFATYGGVLFRLNTPGHFSLGGRAESGRCWLDWDPHRDPETGAGRSSLVVAITKSGERLSLPPSFPNEAIVTGLPEGQLYGFAHCRYTLGDALEVRTANVFLNDAIVVLNSIRALKDASFDALYVQQSLANPGDLIAVAADGRRIEFVPDNVKPKSSVAYAVSHTFDLRSRDGDGALAFVPLSDGFTKQELVDVALFMPPRGDPKRIPHRVETWRGHLPNQLKKGDVFTADFVYVPHNAKTTLRVLVDKRIDSFAAAPDDAKTEPKTRVVSLLVHRSEQVHGVVVQGAPRVVIAAAMPTASTSQRSGVSLSPRISVAELEGAAELFAAEIVDGQVRKACLYGESLDHGARTVARLSRPTVLTILPEEGRGLMDAGVGPIEVRTARSTNHLFSANHDFPRLPRISQTLKSEIRAFDSVLRDLPDLDSACQRFASLPARIEVAARLAEVEMMRQSAEARGPKGVEKRDLIAEAKKAIAAHKIEQAKALLAEAQKQVLAWHERADREQKPVRAVNTRSAAADLLPPKVGDQDRYEMNYLISFAEERARHQLARLAEALTRAATGRPDESELCEAVRSAEAKLLTEYLCLPIHWTREHIPGQPDFFWRPFVKSAAGRYREDSTWQRALLKYLHPTDQLWLAVQRLQAATQLIGE